MKIIIGFLSLLISVQCFADTEAIAKDGKTVILKDDGTWFYEGQKPEENYEVEAGKDYFYATNGLDERVKVKFQISGEPLKGATLKSAVMSSVIRCRYTAKNEPSYVPRSVFIYDNDGQITLSVEWLGTNAYGAQGKESCFYYSDSAGKLTSPF